MRRLALLALMPWIFISASADAEVMAGVEGSEVPTEQNMAVFLPPSDKPQPPSALVQCLKVVDVDYYDDSGTLRTGQMVINRDLAKDVEEIFAVIKSLKFPIKLMALASDRPFKWSDEELMKAGATSGYNYRLKITGKGLSAHALGRAIDINTFCNPYVQYSKSGSIKKVAPLGAFYDPKARCAISRDTPAGRKIIEEFTKRGWKWGGDWVRTKDYQHFERPNPKGNGAPYCD